jgi:diguanylate cyclase (GGDEF)-like protein
LVPLTDEAGNLTGLIWADDPADRLVPTRDRLQALRLFADQATSALEAARRLERMRELAERDPLTSLCNRRALEAFLTDSQADGLALLVCDLDHFKKINDELGHDAGDATLVAFARVLDSLVRKSDLAVRLGGEEFAIVLPGADAAVAAAVAHELLGATRERFRTLAHGLTVSVGIAVGDSPKLLLRQADRALSVAKRSGRDRAVVHHEDTTDALLAELSAPEGGRGQLGAVLLLAETLDLRDDATARHSRTVASYAVLIGRRLELEPRRVERLRIAGVLHDVGKVGISDAILRKPSPLDATEWAEMQRHSEVGARILANAGLTDVAAWVLAHHERLDGDGYPHGLRAEEIPLEARILAVADAYEAMTAARPYGWASSPEEAAAELERCSGTQFDPDVVAVFLAAVHEHGSPAFVAA